MPARPTETTYTSLQLAYDHFNAALFCGQLPACLITVQRHKGAYGYFSGGRFEKVGDAQDNPDEIALNPIHFGDRTPEKTLSTLAHEMCHLWQYHFGDRPRRAYHDRQWAAKMREIGLIPTDTGQPGGKQTGQKVTHLIDPAGRFAASCAELLAEQPAILYHDRAGAASAGGSKASKASKASKTKYTCPGCELNAWAKPDAPLWCGDCKLAMEAQES